MIDLLFVLMLSIFVIVVLARSIKIASESERFAVFVLGRFQAFKGPGLVLITPNIQKVHRLKVGDVGSIAGSDFARFDDVDIPVDSAASFKQGQAVRIDGFDGVKPRLIASSVPAKTMCPSCGHQF